MILLFTNEVNLLRVTGISKMTARETIGIEMTTSINDYDWLIMVLQNLFPVMGRSRITAKETIGIEMTTSVKMSRAPSIFNYRVPGSQLGFPE